jgi:hypothetical protein
MDLTQKIVGFVWWGIFAIKNKNYKIQELYQSIIGCETGHFHCRSIWCFLNFYPYWNVHLKWVCQMSCVLKYDVIETHIRMDFQKKATIKSLTAFLFFSTINQLKLIFFFTEFGTLNTFFALPRLNSKSSTF